MRRVVIAGAAGRDFHNFNVVYRGRDDVEVVAFTATQIPDIEGRVYPPELAGSRYPDGIRILPEEELAELVRRENVDEVVFAYSDVTHEHVMHVGSLALAAGADYGLLGPRATMIPSSKPVVAICAVRTGSGKSQTTRYVAHLLREAGKRVAVLRHPMPYGDLTQQAVQRFERYEDLDAAECTIEEREEYEPHLAEGNLVFAGIDYAAILSRAEAEADVIVWDGGNNDTPFIKPDLHIVVCDPHRPGHELRYHPGETNLRMADVCVVNKTDTAPPEGVEAVLDSIHRAEPALRGRARRVPVPRRGRAHRRDPRQARARGRGRADAHARGDDLRRGRAGGQAARRRRARRPAAVRGRLDREDVRGLPARRRAAPGHGLRPHADGGAPARRSTRSDAELVLIGTPIDLRRVIDIDKPALRVTYRLQELGEPTLGLPPGRRTASSSRRRRSPSRETRGAC